jgi:hypothetical protein
MIPILAEWAGKFPVVRSTACAPAGLLSLASVSATSPKVYGFFFKPKGVAIIGASANPSKGGRFIPKNVLKGFSGGVNPV